MNTEYKIPAPKVTYKGKQNLRKSNNSWLKITSSVAAAAVVAGLGIWALLAIDPAPSAQFATNNPNEHQVSAKTGDDTTIQAQIITSESPVSNAQTKPSDVSSEKITNQNDMSRMGEIRSINNTANQDNILNQNQTAGVNEQKSIEELNQTPHSEVKIAALRKPKLKGMELSPKDIIFTVEDVKIAPVNLIKTASDDEISDLLADLKNPRLPKLDPDSPLRDLKEDLRDNYKDVAMGFNQIKDGIASIFTKREK